MTSILTHVPAGPTPEAKAEIVWCKITEAHYQVDIRIGTVGWSGRGNVMSLSRFDKLAGQYNSQLYGFMRVLNEGCVRQGAAFFLSEPEDRLRLNFPTLIQPCYPSANVSTLLLTTVDNGSHTYMEGSEAGWMWARNVPEPGRLN